ncbi:MAG TPA: DNA polymerase Y family protein [Acidimicrobiales bacterium]|nr:DNA polymerase Y family protein [Acidimicrobiales bacterium]
MSSGMTSTRTLVLWCPDWAVTAAGVSPEVPAAVLVANRVEVCSAAARREGVRRGLRRREAQACCPDLLVIEHDLGRDARAFEPVVAAAAPFTPRVEVLRPGVCAFATRGPSRYFGGDRALAARVAKAASRAVEATTGTGGCEARVGIADGLFAAALAARGRTVVAEGGSAAFLASFPVSALERPELADLLSRLGIRTLGQLASLPHADVLARFGPDGATAHRLARGLEERPVSGRTPPPDLVVSRELDPPAARVDIVAFAAKALATELNERLQGLGLACTRVRVEAETDHGERLSRLWRHDGTLTAGAMAERVRWQLEGWLRCDGGDGDTGASNGDGSGGGLLRYEHATAGIVLLRLAADEVVADRGLQLGFWGGAAEGDERAARALARVQGMLGPEGVVTAVIGGGRGPGEQVRFVPWGDPREPSRPFDRPWPGRVPAPAPALVPSPSTAAEVADRQGGVVRVTGRGRISAPPARLSVEGGAWEQVTGWAGPWPADERWWDRRAHRRRARFQVVTEGGAAYLLALEGGRWSVEALYD